MINTDQLRNLVTSYENFPKKGVQFKDVMPIFAEPEAFYATILASCDFVNEEFAGATTVLAIEARGFILGAAMAPMLAARFIPIRKVGKTPGEIVQIESVNEYATEILEIKKGLIFKGEKIVIVDDVLATGGTAFAAIALALKEGAGQVSYLCMVELEALKGRELVKSLIPEVNIFSLLKF